MEFKTNIFTITIKNFNYEYLLKRKRELNQRLNNQGLKRNVVEYEKLRERYDTTYCHLCSCNLKLTPLWLDTKCFLNYFKLDNKLDNDPLESEIQSLEIELVNIKEELEGMSETMKKYNPRIQQRNAPTLIIQHKIKQLRNQQQQQTLLSSDWIIDKNGNHIKSLDGIIHFVLDSCEFEILDYNKNSSCTFIKSKIG